MRTALVLGASGFIGGHLVKRLKREGAWVRGVDRTFSDYAEPETDDFVIGDLRDPHFCRQVTDRRFDEVYQLAAAMGGAGYVFTGENDAEIMHDSATINLNVVDACHRRSMRRLFYSSSACMYPSRNQQRPDDPDCSEASAYPADPDSEYGWEKLFSERLYLAYNRNRGMEARVARLHNIFGPGGPWRGGKEKALSALCRKVAMCAPGGEVEVWGDGRQTRSFLYVDECLEGVLRLMRSDFAGPVNIGSDEMVSIDQLVAMIIEISGKAVTVVHVEGPTGVRGRNSDNRLIQARLGWRPSQPLRIGLERTYAWVEAQVRRAAERRGGGREATWPPGAQ